jgi:hypothetical protein
VTAPATAFLTYLWRYMLARLLYDALLRGHAAAALLIVPVAVLVGSAVRRRRRT